MLRVFAAFSVMFVAACQPSSDLVGVWSGALEGCDLPAGDGLALRAVVTEEGGEASLVAGPGAEAYEVLFGAGEDAVVCEAVSAVPVENPGFALGGVFAHRCDGVSHTFELELVVSEALTGDLFADGPVTWTDDAGVTATCSASLTR